MISYLKGKIILAKPDFVILDVNDVGYKVFIKDQKDHTECDLFIHHHIKEDAQDLYGFKTFEELELFEKLISVSGVGPKVALSIMSIAESEEIIQAIISENLGFFQSVPGIGKKVAAKVILDLKGKIAGLQGYGVLGKTEESDELFAALESLGYKSTEVAPLMKKMPAILKSTEEKIKWILKNNR